ncbi:hypothetical protein CspHIS471_0601710 [Cutaneotrichosporon sp. HIS471]|nr:hypothetical protein CspHIS471_0601710 [Cutaneotrichosporon sp. HIS471]
MLNPASAIKVIVTLIVGNILLLAIWLTSKGNPSSLLLLSPFTNSCKGWQPGDASKDPPNCLRAHQFREFQAFHESGIGKDLDIPNKQSLLAAERCVLGITKCPDRPLILIDFFFWHRASRDLWGPGEAVWGWPVVRLFTNKLTQLDGIRAAGFVPIFINGRDEKGFMGTWDLARALPSSIHMYMTDANVAVRCLLDPRCVRPEDYVPHANESLRFPDAPADKVGVLPSWRVLGLSFWGARPNKWKGTPHPCRDWGQCGDEEWPFHILGNKWVLTPYAYPGHTHVPMSIEQACLALPPVTQEDKDQADAVIVLAKLPQYFHVGPAKTAVAAFGRIRDAITPTKLWTATTDNEIERYPLPEAVTQLGKQDPETYQGLVGKARALLGIGLPVISPTPYEALCRGVPVILPYTDPKMPTPQPGWSMYGMSYQHGPLQALGEPYVYSYNVHDPDDLLDKLQRALRTPIEPFIPEDMKTSAVHARIREVLLHNWEGEYNRILREREGGMPSYPDEMVDKCFYGTHLAPCSGKYAVA